MAARQTQPLHPLQIPFDEALFSDLASDPASGLILPPPQPRSLLPLFRVQLIREASSPLSEPSHIGSPDDAARIFSRYIGDRDREHFAILMLDVKNRVIGLHVVSIGTLNAALVAPREVFKAALLANAASILASHNHPSGEPAPSEEDLKVTVQLKLAGEILGIELLDHLILGEGERFTSLKERNLM